MEHELKRIITDLIRSIRVLLSLLFNFPIYTVLAVLDYNIKLV
jgi:hypothetical protein